MRWHRIKAILIHTRYHLQHSLETWTDIFWFPVITTATISGLAAFIGSGATVSSEALVVGLLLWFALEPASYSIAVGALWEVWSRSFSALFISPLTISEFIAGQILFSFVKQIVLLTVVSVVSYAISGFTIFSLGPSVGVYVLLLMIFGWAFGCFVLGLVLRFGTRIQSLAWGLVYAIQPFVGLYYPISIFPEWLQSLSRILPPTHVYDGMRATLAGQPAHEQLFLAGVLNVVYFALGFGFMRTQWEWARKNGALARMEQ